VRERVRGLEERDREREGEADGEREGEGEGERPGSYSDSRPDESEALRLRTILDVE